jgi:pyruvate/2-oxoglutarate dehydrogenase complex dihydrolipoamide acyltransferase (E2) component
MTDLELAPAAAGSDTGMAGLRQQVQQAFPADLWWHCDDHQVLTATGLLWPWEAKPGAAERLQMRPLALTPPAPAPAAAAPAPSPASAAGRAAPAAAPAAGTFGADLDVAAMVAVLQQAARDGVPFCEECARAAQEA